MEPEAASIYCQYYTSIQDEEQQLNPSDEFRTLVENKEKYMVLDIGGNDLGLILHYYMALIHVQPVILKLSENSVARNMSSEVDISNALI